MAGACYSPELEKLTSEMISNMTPELLATDPVFSARWHALGDFVTAEDGDASTIAYARLAKLFDVEVDVIMPKIKKEKLTGKASCRDDLVPRFNMWGNRN
jgi:hypothetical protein